MFKVNDNSHPLERLISLRNRVSYQLPVRTEDGKSVKLNCEFQTHADFVFSASKTKFELNQAVWVRSVTLKGAVWQACRVSFIEEHGSHALFQVSILKPKKAQPVKK